MTTTAQTQPKGEARNRAFSDRSPVAKSYRRFLGTSMLLMFTLLIVGAFVIIANYARLFGDPSNVVLVAGLGCILGGIITATNYR